MSVNSKSVYKKKPHFQCLLDGVLLRLVESGLLVPPLVPDSSLRSLGLTLWLWTSCVTLWL